MQRHILVCLLLANLVTLLNTLFTSTHICIAMKNTKLVELFLNEHLVMKKMDENEKNRKENLVWQTLHTPDIMQNKIYQVGQLI